MKDINKFPKIKPVKLKEESNQNNIQNNFQKDKRNIDKCINKNMKGIFNCSIYFMFFILFILIFVLNYYYTKNAFAENKNIIIPAEKLCIKRLNEMADCLNEKLHKDCQTKQKNLELCYDEVYSFNQKCYIIISELELCYRKYDKDNKKCKNIENELISCGLYFKHFSFKSIKIKELFVLK